MENYFNNVFMKPRFNRIGAKRLNRAHYKKTVFKTPFVGGDVYGNGLGSSSSMGYYTDNEEETHGMGEGTDQSILSPIAYAQAAIESTAKAAQSILPAVAAYRLENQRNKINMELIRAGKQPIEFGATVTVGASRDTKKFIIYGIGALALLIVLPKLMKR